MYRQGIKKHRLGGVVSEAAARALSTELLCGVIVGFKRVGARCKGHLGNALACARKNVEVASVTLIAIGWDLNSRPIKAADLGGTTLRRDVVVVITRSPQEAKITQALAGRNCARSLLCALVAH